MWRSVVQNPRISGRIILAIIAANPKSQNPGSKPPNRVVGISGPLLTMARMLDGARFLSADQFLLTTLIVKLAVMAVLAAMLVRYPPGRAHPLFDTAGRRRPPASFHPLRHPLVIGGAPLA